MRTTTLLPCHESLHARMVSFNGWLMPVQYEGILAEHHATRRHVTLFDTCHMGRLEVTGPAAVAALSEIMTADFATMADGQCRYGFLLNERAGVVDDLIAYRFAADRWMLVVNAGTREKDLHWIRDHLAGRGTVTDRSDSLGKMDVQGPDSPRLVSKVLGFDVTDLPYFRFRETEYRGQPAIVSRTGYTGETGYELYAPADDMPLLWQACLDAGAKPAGLGARDTLRLEAALPLYGHELSEEISPAEAGLMRFVRRDNGFVGDEALRARDSRGPRRQLAGFRMEGRQSARAGNPAQRDGKDVGIVTSGSFSPTLGVAIGLAYLDRELAKPGEWFAVCTARKDVKAAVVSIPFYRRTKS